MSYREWGHKNFYTEVNGRDYCFCCHGENTRYGFRHLCQVLRDGDLIASAKCCYYNRTWEAFEYQSVLREACDKCPAKDREALIAILVKGPEIAAHERAEKDVAAFKAEYDKLSPGMKKALKGVVLNTEEDARTVMGIMKAANLMASIR